MISYLRSENISPLFQKQKSRGFKLGVSLLIVLLLMLYHAKFPSSRLYNAFMSVGGVVQHAVDAPSRFYNWLKETIEMRQTLVNENMKLRYQVVMLQAKLQRMMSLQKENDDLWQLHQSFHSKDQEVKVARILAVLSNPNRQLVVLNKGKNQGVFIGQPVFDKYGLMGQVIESGPYTSTVLLVTDFKSAIPIRNQRTGERGILIGSTDGNSLSLMDAPKTAKLKKGDLLVTSGLAQRFPEGYPVGRVDNFHKMASAPFVSVEVKPIAQVNQSRLVLLVWPNSEQKKMFKEVNSRYQAVR